MFAQVARRAVPVGWTVVGLALMYVLGVFALREFGPLRLPGTVVGPKSDVPPGIFANEPKIAHFYAGTGVLTKGEHAVVCYGVLNVRSVRIEPSVEQIKPALNRCFSVTPASTTTYTLFAEGTDGRNMTASFTIQVNPAPPWFSMFAVDAKQIVRGDRWSFCYSIENALSVRLEPMGRQLPLGKKRCIMMMPAQTMDMRVVATGEGGLTAVEKMRVEVVGRK